MPPRIELCRNFQRGSCRYGDRCKFLHAAPQQSKPNPFGFGTQNTTPFQHTNQQQQMPNPFGFGVQNNTQSRGVNDFGSGPNQFKPFENKWSRFSPLNTSGASVSKQPDNQPPAAKHMCTDAEVCKRMILEENEKPRWKLTCYSHYGYCPCDISGDTSYEELRASAYEDAKHGKSLQYIVDRERSLLNSKLNEFVKLVHEPNTISSAPAPSSQNLFSGGSANTPVVNNGFSSQASSFSQLSGMLNTGPAAVPNHTFGQPNAFQNNSQASSSSMFQMNTSSLSSSGAFGSQLPQQSSQSPFTFSNLTNSSQIGKGSHKLFDFGSTSFGNSAMSGLGNRVSTFAILSETGNESSKPLDIVTNGHQLIIPKESANVDDSIWTKTWKWNLGEIPEEAPPDIHIH